MMKKLFKFKLQNFYFKDIKIAANLRNNKKRPDLHFEY
ncbi:hypothetical protein CHAB381_0378 [Campylobacter hominis ATCC BAA-381]|uniref:Uncharacterized protein n=1 Tax=Campylobacter hominis (strain ATCC BAA-381 / DSM 21671 / CCUG 45161 / LMG 19568 / NCTC 13146 / CH001A) TaxID=360107 RepID=A7I0D8_CAMHC|nr:hypothetical protein CHAB381_0378 [Campylobacter hominis ATCC BAA-381]